MLNILTDHLLTVSTIVLQISKPLRSPRPLVLELFDDDPELTPSQSPDPKANLNLTSTVFEDSPR